MIDLQGFGDQLLAGTVNTVRLALAALALGLVLGLAGASAKTSRYRPLQWIGGAYTTVVRGMPELLVVLTIYFGASQLLMAVASLWGHEDYIEVGAFAAGVVALGLTFGAYATEVFRGALLTVPKGQQEAGLALGLSRFHIFRRITLPQLWRVALPGLGNLFMILMKDTALISVVGYEDIMRQSSIAVSVTKQPFTFYLAAACIYLALTLVAMGGLHLLERSANRGVRRASP